MSDLLLRFVIITLCISAITASILAGIGWGFYLSLRYRMNKFTKPSNEKVNKA